MPFSKKVKNEAKRKSAFRCCLCHHGFVEVHHILPQAEGSLDVLENAAPLCASCHDLYGGNPEKRAQIREQRDLWWTLMEERAQKLTLEYDISDYAVVNADNKPEGKLSRSGIGIYHRVYAEESFEDAAATLLELVNEAQKKFPGKHRILYLDIDGDRRKNGTFDADMLELQIEFAMGCLGPYIKEAYLPFWSFKNPKPQRNDPLGAIRFLPQGTPIKDVIKAMGPEMDTLYVEGYRLKVEKNK